MFCRNCGNELEAGSTACAACGSPVEQAQPNYQQPNYQQQQYYQQPNYQQPYYQQPYYSCPSAIDTPKTWVSVLSFFVPIIGIILFIVWMDTTPIRAKNAGKWAIIGIVVSALFPIFVGIVMTFLMVAVSIG